MVAGSLTDDKLIVIFRKLLEVMSDLDARIGRIELSLEKPQRRRRE